METLASMWTCDPSGLCDLEEKGNTSLPLWDSPCVFNSSPPAGQTWTPQLSPHLQRHKQLQDTLLQREEELARLQEENIKLREFLSSSFVRSLQQKAKNLPADGRKNLKRNLTEPSPLSKQISKRVCRNLTAEFCSESSETSVPSEPNLDLWVLQTLGLKDRDTIDTSAGSSPENNFPGAITSSSSSDQMFTSSLNSSLGSCLGSPFSSVPFSSQRPADEMSSCDDADDPALMTQNCPRTPETFTATGLSRSYKASEALIRSYNQSCMSPVQTQKANHSAAYWTLPPEAGTPSSGLIMNTPWTGAGSSAGPPEPRGQKDLAFRMSLTQSSCVKTHSFPQGQAFVRRDGGGRWNFTWVPRQEP
ncbi:geminin coiled-coil domain-containing protein 1 [Nothobranchius furzeri]|nr:geminin coiled-coil domain-containing protein 1 [Nothobranchius furzeri]